MSGVPSVLIANRGEIACRIIDSVKAQGYAAVADDEVGRRAEALLGGREEGAGL